MRSEFYASVSGIIENEKGEILFQKRQNTGYHDGLFQLPAGHLEGEELYKQALIREMKEELDINVLEEDIKPLHVQHQIEKGGKVYFNIYIRIKKYFGEIKNMEPEKCSELKFIDLENYKEGQINDVDLELLDMIKKGQHLSEKVISL